MCVWIKNISYMRWHQNACFVPKITLAKWVSPLSFSTVTYNPKHGWTMHVCLHQRKCSRNITYSHIPVCRCMHGIMMFFNTCARPSNGDQLPTWSCLASVSSQIAHDASDAFVAFEKKQKHRAPSANHQDLYHHQHTLINIITIIMITTTATSSSSSIINCSSDNCLAIPCALKTCEIRSYSFLARTKSNREILSLSLNKHFICLWETHLKFKRCITLQNALSVSIKTLQCCQGYTSKALGGQFPSSMNVYIYISIQHPYTKTNWSLNVLFGEKKQQKSITIQPFLNSISNFRRCRHVLFFTDQLWSVPFLASAR